MKRIYFDMCNGKKNWGSIRERKKERKKEREKERERERERERIAIIPMINYTTEKGTSSFAEMTPKE